MKHFLALLVVLANLGWATHCSAASQSIIYDTDMAIDDWLALLYLVKHPGVDVVAITISGSGESHCQPALDNARDLLRLADNAEIPVACGDDYPLDGYFVFPVTWQEDSDTLTNIDIGRWIESPHSNTPSNGHAVDLIHRTIEASTTPITIVAVGPLTNIAQWLQRHPGDKAGVAELVMMGGSYQAPGNILVPGFSDGNPNRVSEWNYYIDPVATREVLNAADLDKVMVGLDVTNTVRLTHPFADDFKVHVGNPVSQFVDQVLDNNRWFIETGEYYFWDVMAAIVAVKPELCSGESIAVTGVAEPAGDKPYLGSSDLTMPALNAFGLPRQHLNAATAGQVVRVETGPVTKVCTETEADKVFADFIETLTK
jgi:inosine-uridine nucleoside N-ribohydrolase